MNPKEIKQKFCEAKEADRKNKKTILTIAIITGIISIIIAANNNFRAIGAATVGFYTFLIIFISAAELIINKYNKETENTKKIFKDLALEAINKNIDLKSEDMIVLNQYEKQIEESDISNNPESDWIFKFSKDVKPFHSGERIKRFKIKNNGSEIQFTTLITITEKKVQRTVQERFYNKNAILLNNNISNKSCDLP